MSLRINIEISLAENESPNAREQAILDSMAAHPSNGVAAARKEAVTAAEEAAITKVVEKVTAGVAAKTEAPKTTASRPVGRPKAAPKAAETPMALDTTLDEEVPDDQDIAEAEAAEVEDDLLGGEEEAAAVTTYTKADAIAAATKLVSTQKQAVVKKALGKIPGAKRVSDLSDDADIQVFMAALEG